MTFVAYRVCRSFLTCRVMCVSPGGVDAAEPDRHSGQPEGEGRGHSTRARLPTGTPGPPGCGAGLS